MRKAKVRVEKKSAEKGFLAGLKKVAQVAVTVTGVVLAAPIKLPIKLLQVVKYLALAAGLVQAVQKTEERTQDE